MPLSSGPRGGVTVLASEWHQSNSMWNFIAAGMRPDESYRRALSAECQVRLDTQKALSLSLSLVQLLHIYGGWSSIGFVQRELYRIVGNVCGHKQIGGGGARKGNQTLDKRNPLMKRSTHTRIHREMQSTKCVYLEKQRGLERIRTVEMPRVPGYLIDSLRGWNSRLMKHQ